MLPNYSPNKLGIMRFSTLLVLAVFLAQQGRAAPSDEMQVGWGAQFESPGGNMPLEREPRRYPTHSGSPRMIFSRGGHHPTERLHAHPRSLLDTPSRSLLDTPSSSSSVTPYYLLAGIAIGILGTLSVLGLVLIFRRAIRRKKGLNANLRRRISIPLRMRPSAPRNFRHLEHFTTTLSDTPPPNGASSLRVAHRRPDGSWEFSEARYAYDPNQGPDPTVPVSPSTIFPVSPSTAFSNSPISESSGTAFSYDDASSSKTGPPPYISPHYHPLPDKSRGRRR